MKERLKHQPIILGVSGDRGSHSRARATTFDAVAPTELALARAAGFAERGQFRHLRFNLDSS